MSYIGNQPPDIGAYEVQSFNGGGTEFTLQRAATTPSVLLFIDGVRQTPTDAYSVSGVTLTTTGTTPSGTDNVTVMFMGDVVDIGAPSDDTVSTAKIQDDAVTTDKILDDAVTADKLANSINTEIAANTAKVTNATHTGDVTGATALTIAADAVTPAKMADSAFLANRNMVINGAMGVSQKSTSVAAVGAGINTVDRWYTTKTNAGTWTQTQDAATVSTAGFGYSLKMDCTTALGSLAAGDRLMMSYRFEGQNCQNLKKGTASAESVTISFWVNATKTGTYVLEMWDHPNSRHIASLYTVSVTNTWEYKTVTFAGDTTGALTNNNGKILELHWYLAAGSNYTSGTLATSWAASSNANRAVGQVNAADSTSNNFHLAGVQMEVGDTATPFEHKTYGQELAACERYYQTKGMGMIGGVESTSSTTGTWRTGVTFSTEMRAAPTVAVGSSTITYNRAGIAAHASISNTIAWTNNITTKGLVMGVGNYDLSSASGSTLGIVSAGGNQFTFDAEL